MKFETAENRAREYAKHDPSRDQHVAVYRALLAEIERLRRLVLARSPHGPRDAS